MIKNAFSLYKMKICSVFRRYKYNYISETVALFCGAIILLLFVYMFNDFLNEQLRYISKKMTEWISLAFSIVVLFLSSFYVGKTISKEKTMLTSCLALSFFLGDSRKTRLIYWILYILTLIVCVYFPLWCFVLSYFMTWDIGGVFSLTVSMLMTSAIVAHLYNRRVVSKEAFVVKKLLLTHKKQTSLEAMFVWRIKQLLWRNQQSRLCLFISILFVLFVFYLGYTSKPSLFVLSASLAGGLFVSFAFSLQTAADFQSVWLEKNSGVSHDNYLKTLRKLGVFLGVSIGFLTSVSWFFSQTGFDYEWHSWLMVFKVGIVSFLSPWLLPYIVFQVDIHRPFIHILTVTIVSVFLGTAVFAHLLSIFIFPFIRYYGLLSQENRFYRA